MKVKVFAAIEFVGLVLFWLALSDQRDPPFLGLAVLSAAIVTWLTSRLVRGVLAGGGSPGGSFRRAGWFVVYVIWMLGRILVASAQVAHFALRPSLPFLPRFVRFSTTMQRPLSRVLLANSITLVPGTMTVRLDDDVYLVHCLVPGAASDLETAQMQNMIGRFMGEQPEDPPEMHWGPLIEEAVK
jgi:multicomponent Na+:H+ antiporter subunit E